MAFIVLFDYSYSVRTSKFAFEALASMVRGPKKHLKRLNAPHKWMLGKLGGIFVSKY